MRIFYRRCPDCDICNYKCPCASTYNVGLLDSHGNAVSDWFEEVPINNPVGSRNLIVGEEYHFVVSSNDVPERGCTANYEVY